MTSEGFLKRNAFVAGGAVVGLMFGIPIYLSCGHIQRQRQEYKRLYHKSQEPIIGTVLEESYENNLSSVPEKKIDGLLSQAYSNETVKLDSKYTLRVKTDDKRILGISIIDGEI
jgi:hypothetical protein